MVQCWVLPLLFVGHLRVGRRDPLPEPPTWPSAAPSGWPSCCRRSASPWLKLEVRQVNKGPLVPQALQERPDPMASMVTKDLLGPLVHLVQKVILDSPAWLDQQGTLELMV